MARITEVMKNETHDCIINSARELFMSLGYDKTTTKAIAKKCGIAEGTLFNYFANKDEILVAVFEKIVFKNEEILDKELPSVEEILISSSLRPIKKMNIVPKSILIDIFVIVIKMAKKKKKIYQKFAEIDFVYMKDLENLLSIYLDLNEYPISEKELSEIIYGVVAAEFVLYLYNTESTYQEFEEVARRKLSFILKPYIKGEDYVN